MNIKKILFAFLLIFALVIAMASTWLYSQIDSSLPVLEGKKNIYGLHQQVDIIRDAAGIPTIRARNREDLATATGFLHAQERFFQMDLLRRNSAGELSSLFGNLALEYDKEIRRHRFRARASSIVKSLPESELAILKAYTLGVNAGLDYLKAPPFEYLILNQAPVEWQEEDTILTVLSMYIDLQYHKGERERSLGALSTLLTKDAFNFLHPLGSMWDAPIDNSQLPTSPMPIGNWLKNDDKSNLTETSAKIKMGSSDVEQFPGSNNWAISNKLTSTKSSMIANDMHLGIRVPNTWYRARFEYKVKNIDIEVTGLTLPGTPTMVTGSNTKIAWGFTNSYGDWSDVIELDTNESNSEYLTPDGYKKFQEYQHIIAIKGGESVRFNSKETIWGPVIGKNAKGKLLAYRWVAHDKEAVNLASLQLETATNVEQATTIASKAGIPAQNMVVGDNNGNIAWTIMGPIPLRSHAFGQVPTSWSSGDNRWLGYLASEDYPKVLNPKTQRIWTANSRVIGNKDLDIIGNGGYALGARALQIKNGLFKQNKFNEEGLLAVALDDKAVFLSRWHKYVLDEVLTKSALNKNQEWQEVKNILQTEKELTASQDSVAYRLIRNFRLAFRDNVFEQLNKNLKGIDQGYRFKTIKNQMEPALWQLLTQKPNNTVVTPSIGWQALIEETLNDTINEMTAQQTLAKATWGQQNTTKIQHPLSKALPILSPWLDMPELALSGDSYMPKVQGQSFGASQRMIVSPGHEKTGILHMPTSQSGHPWSPYYKKGHNDWAYGKASSFLPGKPKYKLTLSSY